MDFLELRSFGKSCELTLVTLTCQVNFCDGGVRLYARIHNLVTSCDALLPSVMRRESQLGVLPVVKDLI